ncbi:unnamed protein product [Protopolystoma xenopodis]|uniref:Uncharacterized protein n=1 Tax=Protopolystoma xenopodis TaxID=117903 RepID=A0A3S5CRY2_9PLAT|nr:unnamed protein product [Protopolystoma xenopodis]
MYKSRPPTHSLDTCTLIRKSTIWTKITFCTLAEVNHNVCIQYLYSRKVSLSRQARSQDELNKQFNGSVAQSSVPFGHQDTNGHVLTRPIQHQHDNPTPIRGSTSANGPNHTQSGPSCRDNQMPASGRLSGVGRALVPSGARSKADVRSDDVRIDATQEGEFRLRRKNSIRKSILDGLAKIGEEMK